MHESRHYSLYCDSLESSGMPRYVSHSGLSNYTGHGHGYSEKLSRKHFIVLIFSHSAINVIGHNANNVICLTTKSDIRLYTVKSVLLSNGFLTITL